MGHSAELPLIYYHILLRLINNGLYMYRQVLELSALWLLPDTIFRPTILLRCLHNILYCSSPAPSLSCSNSFVILLLCRCQIPVTALLLLFLLRLLILFTAPLLVRCSFSFQISSILFFLIHLLSFYFSLGAVHK